jgi:hypothetical protein
MYESALRTSLVYTVFGEAIESCRVITFIAALQPSFISVLSISAYVSLAAFEPSVYEVKLFDMLVPN